MISLINIIKEGYQCDADDYIPYSELYVGDLVRDVENVEEEFVVKEILGDGKLLVCPTDDDSVILPMYYDREVAACRSDNVNRADDGLGELWESKDEKEGKYDYSDPLTTINYDTLSGGRPQKYDILAQGKGLNKEDLKEGLLKVIQDIQQREGDKFEYAKVTQKYQPAINGSGSEFKFTETGKYARQGGGFYHKAGEEAECWTLDSVADHVIDNYEHDCSPRELGEHIIGWYLIKLPNKFLPEYCIYPMLDAEGVKMYIGVREKMADELRRYYATNDYNGD